MCHLLSYNIIDISCGLAHNAVLGYEKKILSSQNPQEIKPKLFTWGSGMNGALGFGTRDDLYVPTINEFFENHNVKEAQCGYSHTIILTGINDILNKNTI